MPIMIVCGKEIIRICPTDKKKIEYSTNQGRTWIRRFTSNNTIGEFIDLMDNGKEILATTSTGLCFSTNEGRSWIMRKRN